VNLQRATEADRSEGRSWSVYELLVCACEPAIGEK